MKIAKSLISGSLFYFARQIIVLLLQLATNFFILKWINPTEFGYFATLNIVIGILQIFSDGGISVYLIQKKDKPNREEISNLISFQLITYFIIHIIVFIGYCIRNKFGLFNYLIIIAFSVPFTLFKSISFSTLERNLNFNKISIIEIIEILIYSIVAIVLAYFGYGIWSLVFANLAKSICGFLVSNLYTPISFSIIQPKFNNDLISALRFGFHFHSPNIINSLRILINPLIIGPLYGMFIVGINDRAIYIAGLPLFILGAVQQKILFPYFSRIQDNKILIKKMFINSYYLSTFVDKLLYIPLVLLMPYVFNIYFHKWHEIIPFVNIVILGNMIFGSFFFSLYPVLNALGKSSLISKFSLFTLGISWILIYPLSKVCHEYSYVYLSFILWIIGLVPIRKIFIENIGKIKFSRPFFVPLLSFLPTIYFSYLVNSGQFNSLHSLALILIFSYFLYFLLVFVMDRKFIFRTLSMLKFNT